jgi:CheY-like chemotaxis protein
MKKNKIAFIIDDDPIHVFLTKKYIEKAGGIDAVEVFKNGKEAYDYLSTINSIHGQLPELILLDINMPIWDGWRFLDEFRKLQIKEKINIYLSTSSIYKEDYERAKEYGLTNKYLVKPLSLEKITSIINSA